MFEVRPIKNLLEIDMKDLVNESKEDGFRFLTRLEKEYVDHINTFQKEGEGLYGVFTVDDVMIAIGGINIDPYSNEQIIGRLRRFYVSKNFRRKGIGRILLEKIIDEAKEHFHTIVLHTDTKEGDQFYMSLGFNKSTRYPKASHYLQLTFKNNT